MIKHFKLNLKIFAVQKSPITLGAYWFIEFGFKWLKTMNSTFCIFEIESTNANSIIPMLYKSTILHYQSSKMVWTFIIGLESKPLISEIKKFKTDLWSFFLFIFILLHSINNARRKIWTWNSWVHYT